MQRLKNNQKNFLGKDANESEEIEFIDDTTPGPGHYNVSVSTAATQSQYSRTAKEPVHAFGSQQKRFRDDTKAMPVGPGNYNLGQNLSKSAIAFK